MGVGKYFQNNVFITYRIHSAEIISYKIKIQSIARRVIDTYHQYLFMGKAISQKRVENSEDGSKDTIFWGVNFYFALRDRMKKLPRVWRIKEWIIVNLFMLRIDIPSWLLNRYNDRFRDDKKIRLQNNLTKRSILST